MPNTSPSATPPLTVPHREQLQAADCLAACAAMVLDFLGGTEPYARLLSILGISPIGAPRRNILRLARLGVEVEYREATLSILARYLQADQPVMAFVDTAELSYWPVSTNHAVVVVGIDEETVWINDPAFPDAPITVSTAEFDLAWFNGDNTCAIIRASA